MPQAVASSLAVREHPGRSLLETLADHLQSKKLLLILDNCEHVLAACAHLADALLRAAANLRILATSREALRVEVEIAWPVPSLSLPPPYTFPPLPELTRYEAVQLFVDRARAALPGFDVTSQNAFTVAQVCYRLDGIPLAIELAAARVKVLSVAQIAECLAAHDALRLLTRGSAVASPRHQTLRAALDWSYYLLSAKEQALLGRLSVFAGGFTLETAEAVCTDHVGQDGILSYEVLDLLSGLVDKSLVVVERPESGARRYRLLETIRQYG